MCNNTAQELGISWLSFVPVEQLLIELRTGMKQSLLSTSRLNISSNCTIFYEELTSPSYLGLKLYETEVTE